MIERDQIFIGGEWRPSSGDGVIDVINPATEDVIAKVPRGSAEDVHRAAKAAAGAALRLGLQAPLVQSRGAAALSPLPQQGNPDGIHVGGAYAVRTRPFN